MPETTPPAAPPAAPSTDGGAAPAPLTADDVRALIEPFAKKINGEQASLRKALKALTGGEPSDGAPAPAPAAAALTADDLTLARKVGAALAKLPEAVQAMAEEKLQGLAPAAQAAVLDLLTALSGATPASADSDGARRPTAPTTSRGAPAASGGQPLPRTLSEYAEQRKDAKRRAELDADPAFDPTVLPRR